MAAHRHRRGGLRRGGPLSLLAGADEGGNGHGQRGRSRAQGSSEEQTDRDLMFAHLLS